MAESFTRILDKSEGFFKDRGSKFLSFAFPLEDESDIEEHLTSVKKRFFDARHHCYAYRIGWKGEKFYMTDDGEPSHSAGTPILNSIRSHKLTNVLIIVVRYFGGTKLGIRGLINAYQASANDAITNSLVEQIVPKVIFTLSYPYEQTSIVNRVLHKQKLKQVEAHYTDTCQITYAIESHLFPPLQKNIEKNLINLEVIGTSYY